MVFSHIVRYLCVSAFNCFELPPLVNIFNFILILFMFQLYFNLFLSKFHLYLFFFFTFIIFDDWENFARNLRLFIFGCSSLNILFSHTFRCCLKKTAFQVFSFSFQKLFIIILAFRTSGSVFYRCCCGLVL